MEAAGSIFATFDVLQQRAGEGVPFAAAFSRSGTLRLARAGYGTRQIA